MAGTTGLDTATSCVTGKRSNHLNYAPAERWARNALEHQDDIAKVQTWLGHESISTTQIYDARKDRPEEFPTYKVEY